MKIWFIVTIFLFTFILNFYPSEVAAIQSIQNARWWCGSPITECEWGRDGLLMMTKAEILLLKYFGDVRDEFRKIAYCESRGRQFLENGEVVKSPSQDYGYLQINERWLPKAEELELDIMTMEGNFAMARIIYSIQGFKAWKASYNCHKIK